MAIGFRLIADPGVTEYRVVRTSGAQAYTIGDAVMYDVTSDAIDVAPASASSKTTNIYGVAMETIVAATTSLLVALVNDRQRWQADVANNGNTNHNYERMVFVTNAATISNTGTDDTTVNACFQQLGLAGPAASKRIVGRFLTTAVAA